MSTQYVVQGGHHEDFTFRKILKENFEFYGPFDTYQEARDTWKAKMWQNVDDGQHKLEIVEWKTVEPDELEWEADGWPKAPYPGWPYSSKKG